VGRRKEIINRNRGSKKIVPLEVNIALSMHPAVAEVAAFAIRISSSSALPRRQKHGKR
jgi:hypothetical protein